MQLSKWQKINKPLTLGGLGLQTSELKNKAMLGGLTWRLLTIRAPWPDILIKRLYVQVNPSINRTPCNLEGFL